MLRTLDHLHTELPVEARMGATGPLQSCQYRLDSAPALLMVCLFLWTSLICHLTKSCKPEQVPCNNFRGKLFLQFLTNFPVFFLLWHKETLQSHTVTLSSQIHIAECNFAGTTEVILEIFWCCISLLKKEGILLLSGITECKGSEKVRGTHTQLLFSPREYLSQYYF